MKIRIITTREIGPADLDIWLEVYRDQCAYPIDIEKIKVEKSAVWSGDFPETRSKATTSLEIIEE